MLRQAVKSQGRTRPRACVFRFLWSRVALKLFLWIRELLNEFYFSDDKILREFVKRGDAPISEISVDIHALSAAASPPVNVEASPRQTRKR